VAQHLNGKLPRVRETFDRLLRRIEAFGPVTLNPVKTSIQVKSSATFMSIKLKKDRLFIDFFLSNEIDQPPIFKSIRVSKKRVIHFAMLEEPRDVNTRLVRWLRESYQLIEAASKEPHDSAID
jgi:hypothetical protein